MTLSDDLAWRGLIKDKTFGDIKWLDKPQTFYHGIDVSSDSMTIGNLAAMLMARRFINVDWRAVLLVGGATSLVGDPGGKTEERVQVRREDIVKNTESIKNQINQLFGGQSFTLVDNYHWWNQSETQKGVQYLDFLREYGKRFSMTELMQREFVTERMGEGGSGISYAEFSYGLIQAYDFFRLSQPKGHNDGEGVVLQIGGSDQWSNMLLGTAMIRKKAAKEAHALSMPLVVNKTTGKKFGKSEEGAIWLDAGKTSPTDFYQFWINTDDSDVESCLKIFTLLSKDEIESVMDRHKTDSSKRLAQSKLAEEVSKLVHGVDASEAASAATEYLTGELSVADADDQDLTDLRKEITSIKTQPGSSIIDVLVQSGLASSNSDARRLMESKAVYVNGAQFGRSHLETGDFKNGRLMLRRGKAFKDSALIELA